jgi:hypothetical protein
VTKRKSKTATARRHFEPDKKLIRAESERLRLPEEEKLRAVVSEFGPIPVNGQRDLLHHVYSALVQYWFRARSKTITPSETLNRLKTIEAAARKLLSLFEVKCDAASSWIVENALNLTSSQRLSILPQRHNGMPTGPSTASDPARPLNPKRTTDVLPKPDNCKSYRHRAHAQTARPVQKFMHTLKCCINLRSRSAVEAR